QGVDGVAVDLEPPRREHARVLDEEPLGLLGLDVAGRRADAERGARDERRAGLRRVDARRRDAGRGEPVPLHAVVLPGSSSNVRCYKHASALTGNFMQKEEVWGWRRWTEAPPCSTVVRRRWRRSRRRRGARRPQGDWPRRTVRHGRAGTPGPGGAAGPRAGPCGS